MLLTQTEPSKYRCTKNTFDSLKENQIRLKQQLETAEAVFLRMQKLVETALLFLGDEIMKTDFLWV